MATCVREALFADTPGGPRFCLITRPEGAVKGVMLFSPPFAEELNKARRMVALGAREFAAEGWAVLQIDLKGCGDSSGDLGEASWQDWKDDLSFGWRLLRQRFGDELPGAVWSLRGGSLLVSDWLADGGMSPHWLMWQPIISGKQHLTQFLRLKVANEMLTDADTRTAMARIRASLNADEAVEVAGYEVSSKLASAMEAATVRIPGAYGGRLALIELSTAEPLALSPGTSIAVAKWGESGANVKSEVARGPAFWQTQEIELAPAAVAPSVRFLRTLLT